MRELIRKLVDQICPMDALEKEQIESVLEWIDSGLELCRIQKPASPPKHLVSYTLLFDQEEESLLLVDHKKAQLWLPPGGHVEVGEHPLAAADRELMEELGVSLALLTEEPMFLSVSQTIGLSSGHCDVSLWYVYLAEQSQTFNYDKSEFERIAWFPIDSLPFGRSDPNMRRFCSKLLTQMQSIA